MAESDAYLQAVADASPRVTAGTAAVSWQGRPLRYAIVGRPGNVTTAGLARIRLQTALLRDPRTPAKLAAHLARTTPAILWVAGNVHGGEESGADASLRVLYELADREDSAAGRSSTARSWSCFRYRIPMAGRPTAGATPMTST